MRPFLLLAIAVCLTAAPPHRWWKCPPLPDALVHDMLEGNDGYLWLALGDGLYRFDGYRYEHFIESPIRSPRELAAVGRHLWFREMQRVGSFDGQTFSPVTVMPYHAGLTGNGKALFWATGDKWLRGLPGALAEIGDSNIGGLTFDNSGGAWGVADDDILHLPHGAKRFVRRWPGTGKGFHRVLSSVTGRLWLSNRTSAIAYRDGKRDTTVEPVHWLPSQDEGMAVMGRHGRVWIRGRDIISDPPGTRFQYQLTGQKQIPGKIAEGAGGYLWLHQPPKLLSRMIPDPTWTPYMEDEFGKEGPTLTLRDAKDRLWAGTGTGMYLYENGWQPRGNSTHYYVDLLALPDGRLLAASRHHGLWILDANGKQAEQIQQPALPGGRDVTRDFRRLFRDHNGRIWVGNRHVFLEAIPVNDSFRLEVRKLPTEVEYLSPIDMAETKDGQLWVGHTEGLARLNEQGAWERLPTDRPVSEVRTLSVDATGKTFWVGYRKNGFFSRVEIRNGVGVVTQFNASAGYGPRETRFLRVDSRGWIWRGTDDGVRVSDGIHLRPEDWLHLQGSNGLPGGGANPNGFREETDGSVWLCTTKGTVHVRPDQKWFAAPETAAPLLSRIEIDASVLLTELDSPPDEIPQGTKRVQVYVGSLAASPFRDFPFRYRIGPRDREWKVAEREVIVLDNPVDGRYQLDVAFAGTGNSGVRTWAFRVGPEPPPYLAYAAGAVAALGLVGVIFRRTRPMELLRYRVGKRVHAWRHRSNEAMASQPELVGRVLGGRYLVKRIASTGGTSTLYEAADQREGGRVAIKVLEGRAAETKWTRKAFTTEAALLRSIAHPGVVPLLESWIDEEGRLLLVMPYLKGRSLRSWVGCGAEEAGPLLEQLGEALDAIHARGIVHRDVKPDNVLVTETGTVVLIDFGAAGMAGQREGMVMTDGISGTPAYMGPERLGGFFSAATDAYSLGVVAMELLTGKRPEGWEDGIGEIRERFGEAAAERFAEILADMPETRPVKLGDWVRALRAATSR